MRKYIFLTILFSCLHIAARGQTIVTLDDFDLSWVPQPTQAKAMRYWFDDDAATVQTTSLLTGSHTIDVSSLMDGLHTLHCQVVDTDGNVAYASSGVFLKMNTLATTAPTGLRSLRYWFDDDGATGVKTLATANGVHTIDVSPLMDGLHTLHCQVVDTDGNVAYASSGVFLKMNTLATTAPTGLRSLRYWFDDDGATDVKTLATATGVHTIDVSSLMDGLHTLHCQVVDTDGNVAYASSGVFLKMNTLATTAPTGLRSLRYWFDDDGATDVKTLASANGIHTLDVSPLMDGLHTLHCQVVDTDGNVAYASSGVFLKMNNISATTAVTASKLLYWFDDETAFKTVDMTGGVKMLDVSALIDGLHTLHYQVVCSDNQLTASVSSVFLKMNMAAEAATTAQSLRYWFDEEQTATILEITEGVQMLDASRLMDGLHTVHYQIADSKNMLGAPASAVFLKMNMVTDAATTARTLRYWYDTEQTATTVEITEGVQMLDASRLMDGLHTVHYQIADSKNMLGAPASAVFLKMNMSAATTTAQSLRYWFDNDASTLKVTDVAGGTQTLDVSTLPAGLHTLNYQLTDSEGRLGAPVTRVFVKNFERLLPEGENRITKYQYWLNTNSQAMQTVELSSADNPYTLISLLPLQKEPIHSDCFHFEVTDGVPTIYAKNTLHVRFYDAQNYFIDGDKPFVDYSVNQEVEPVGELQATQTFPKVTENEVRWYTMQAAPGDTAAFRLSQAATLQVFAPSGKEVLKASESASVNWNGIHTWENGTYYVAVHDVTGSQSNMTLNYMHMDKYDVVDWDVHTVGNGGCSTITFKGNGFRDLYAIDLFTAQGDSVHHVYIGHESDATTSVVFDFTDAAFGNYHAKFRFAEEDKVFNNLVTVEEAVDIELATNVSFPSTFLRGTSTTYTIKITNKGNMTAYAVPIYTWLRTKSQDGISHIEYEGLGLAGLFDNIETDSLSASDIEELKVVSASAGDDHYFLKFWLKDKENANDSVFVRSNYFFTTIGPKETKTLRLTVSAKEEVFSYFTVPKEWHSFDTVGVPNGVNAARARFKSPSLKDQYCCIRSRVECVASITADVAGIANKVSDIWAPGTPTDIALGVASCLADALNQLVSATGTVMCDDDSNVEDKLWEKVKAISNGLSIANTLSGCASKLLPAGKLKALLDAINKISEGEGWLTGLGIGIDFEGCKEAFSTPIPGCPPDPDGGGGSSTPQPPSDPNDIYGYLSEAGSKFIADTVAKVNYTIEFENDTAFAQASAHTIVIRDTLDSRYFDLKSFLPTSVKIGERESFLDETEDVKTAGGVTSFLKTIDMRPEINAIAQVEGTYSQQTGIAEWRFTSLDPMTMEQTDDLMQGILPVNYDGTSGIGEVMFQVGVKPNKGHGTEIKNRASIVFDYEEAILTPIWVNTVDARRPVSRVVDATVLNDSTATVSIDATDDGSGPWRYNVYVQYGSGAWFLAAENVPADTTATVKIYEGIVHHFYCVATDMAGNVEVKEPRSELTLTVSDREKGDVNGDGAIDVADIATIISVMAGDATLGVAHYADVNRDGVVDVADIATIISEMAARARMQKETVE